MSEFVNPRVRSSANVFDAATSTINSEGMILIIASPLMACLRAIMSPGLIAGKRKCLLGGADLRLKLVKTAGNAHLFPSSTSSWFGLLSQAPSSAGPLPVRCGGATRLSLVSGGAISIREGRKMAVGTVKWFNAQKGYGFIQPQGGGKDMFVHISAVERAGLSGLNEGQVLEYEEVSNRGKTSAENLKAQR